MRSSAIRQRSYTLNIRVQLPPHQIRRASHTAITTTPKADAMAAIYPLPTLSSSVPHHNRDMVLQKYLLLQEQHESLLEHLDQLRPLQTGNTVTTTATTSPATTPTRATFTLPNAFHTTPHHFRTSPTPHATGHQRRASLPQYSAPRMHADTSIDAVMDGNTRAELALEEAKLCDVNEGIKRALTELLNCNLVREDRAFRTWVQCRLMETEKELRHGRRRRSCPID